MKKKPVKNRKRELFSKRLFYLSLIISLVLIIGSSLFVGIRLWWPHVYISPIVTASEKGAAGQVPADDVFVPTIEKALSQANIPYTDVKLLDSSSCQITLDDNELVIVSTQKDISQQIASLQLITSRLTMEGKRFSRLDLRYDQPVLSD